MKIDNNIYLDNAATTIPNQDVVALYNDYLINQFANPSSIHGLATISSSYLNKAKEEILNSFKLKDYKVIFTSGATEANNIAIKGIALKYASRGKHIITSNIEHPSVLECFRQLESDYDFKVTYLKVNKEGLINLDDLEKVMDNETTLVSIMAVNNEVGSINPINDIAKIVHKYPKAIFHVDATQAIGKEEFNYNDVDLFSFSAHKIHGIKNSGALIYKAKLSFYNIISGGSQEYGVRPGTIDLASACAIAKAVKISINNIKENKEKVRKLSSIIYKELNSENIIFNSSKKSSPYIVNFSLTNKKASVVVEALSNKGIYVSSVSACNSKKEATSYVVYNMSQNEKLSANTVRISLSYLNNEEEIHTFISEFKSILRSIK